MFCPKCGSEQSEELKFCKACGTNLGVVRTAVAKGDAGEKFDWTKTWVAEMLLSGEENVRRAAEIERLQGITPETKRRNEIKAGVITASVGVGLMITLFVLMQAIVLNPRIPPETAVILSSLWVAGVIPLLVGTALIVNGVFISKKGTGNAFTESRSDDQAKEIAEPPKASFLPPRAETNPLERDVFSVTDETTRHLEQRVEAKKSSGN
jgi:hypothetical protein